MSVQILDIAGQKIAVLPLDDYNRLLEAAEDREDLLAAEDSERRRADGMEYLPAEMVNRIFDGENALHVWREYRGLTIADLAERSGFGTSMIAKVERGQRQGKMAFWKSVSAVLNVLPEDVMPLE